MVQNVNKVEYLWNNIERICELDKVRRNGMVEQIRKQHEASKATIQDLRDNHAANFQEMHRAKFRMLGGVYRNE